MVVEVSTFTGTTRMSIVIRVCSRIRSNAARLTVCRIACCSTACPLYGWNPDWLVGPAGLLQAYRLIVDSRDEATAQRLDNLEDPYRLFRCRTTMKCVVVCPKDFNPARAIGNIRSMLTCRSV